jgi:hypothetical protein
MGMSGGMVRLKGNSPKVQSDGKNRPRTIKQYSGQPGLSSGIGNVGMIGQHSGSANGLNGYNGMRNISSSKGMNRPT